MSRRVKNRRPFRVLAWRFMELKGWAVMLFKHLYIPHVSLRRRLIATVARHNHNIESLVKHYVCRARLCRGPVKTMHASDESAISPLVIQQLLIIITLF